MKYKYKVYTYINMRINTYVLKPSTEHTWTPNIKNTGTLSV